MVLSFPQVPGGPLLHLRNPLWLWQLLRLPPIPGHPGPLLQATTRSGQRTGDDRQLPLLRGSPVPPENRGKGPWPFSHLPDAERLPAGPDLLVPDLPPDVALDLKSSR